MSLVGLVKKIRYMQQLVTLNQEATRNDLV